MTTTAPPSAQTTLAIILGVSACPHSPNLTASEAFAKSAQGFRAYLTGNTFRLPEDHLLDRFDSNQSPTDTIVEISDWLDQQQRNLKSGGEALRDLIIYYCGHGGFTRRERAYILVTRSTRQGMEGASSIRIVDLAQAILNGAAFARRYLILDCCFSSTAFDVFQGPALEMATTKTMNALPSQGTALLCSSSAQDVSIAPVGEEFTMFSGALLATLRDGLPYGQAALSFADVGQLVQKYIRDKYPGEGVRPEIHSPDQREGNIAYIPLFANVAYERGKLTAKESEVGPNDPPSATSVFVFVALSQATAIIFVDIMRIYYTLSIEETYRANIKWYEEFIQVANKHLNDLTSQLSMLASFLSRRLHQQILGIHGQLSQAITRLETSPKRMGGDSELVIQLKELSSLITDFCAAAAPNYYAQQRDILARVVRENDFDLDRPIPFSEIWRLRMMLQRAVYGPTDKFSSIMNDLKLKFALLYFLIDHDLLQLVKT